MSNSEKTVKVALDEGRMLVLVIQVLLGFSFQGIFQPGFVRVSAAGHIAHLLVFLLLILSLGLLLMIPAEHRLAEKGMNSRRFLRFTTNTMSIVMLPFAAATSLGGFIVAGTVVDLPSASILALGIFAATTTFWYLLPLARAWKQAGLPSPKTDMKDEMPPLDERINQLLTECRVVLPGTQALLGFQFIAFLTDAFAKLPQEQKWLHLLALGFILLAAILLMFPAAFHRIGEGGRNTEALLSTTNAALIAALPALAAGLSLDFFIVAGSIMHSLAAAMVCSGGTFAFLMLLWYGVPLSRIFCR